MFVPPEKLEMAPEKKQDAADPVSELESCLGIFLEYAKGVTAQRGADPQVFPEPVFDAEQRIVVRARPVVE